MGTKTVLLTIALGCGGLVSSTFAQETTPKNADIQNIGNRDINKRKPNNTKTFMKLRLQYQTIITFSR